MGAIVLVGLGALGVLARESYCNSQATIDDEDEEDMLFYADVDESTDLI